MKTRNYLVRIDAEVDDNLRKLRKLGYLPSNLVRKAIADMVQQKLKEIEEMKKKV